VDFEFIGLAFVSPEQLGVEEFSGSLGDVSVRRVH
jgi:hypothetical protein